MYTLYYATHFKANDITTCRNCYSCTARYLFSALRIVVRNKLSLWGIKTWALFLQTALDQRRENVEYIFVHRGPLNQLAAIQGREAAQVAHGTDVSRLNPAPSFVNLHAWRTERLLLGKQAPDVRAVVACLPLYLVLLRRVVARVSGLEVQPVSDRCALAAHSSSSAWSSMSKMAPQAAHRSSRSSASPQSSPSLYWYVSLQPQFGHAINHLFPHVIPQSPIFTVFF